MYESIFCWFIAILKEGIDVQVSVYQNRLLLDQISGPSYSLVSTIPDEAPRISVPASNCFFSHLPSTDIGSMHFSCHNLNNLPRCHLNWSAPKQIIWPDSTFSGYWYSDGFSSSVAAPAAPVLTIKVDHSISVVV